VCFRNDGERLVRVVDDEQACGDHETFVRLSPGEQGPQGPPGERGADGEGTVAQRWYRDKDGDGFGEWYDHLDSPGQPPGYADSHSDCDDESIQLNPTKHDPDADSPGTAPFNPATTSFHLDRYDPRLTGDPLPTIDNDCDGIAERIWYQDDDRDGYGDAKKRRWAETKPWLAVPFAGDCDDSDASVHPRTKTCSPQATPDADGDGHLSDDCDDQNKAMYPGHPETLQDGYDNDCDAKTPDVMKRDPDYFRPGH
jgi:putative metal-binding protein